MLMAAATELFLVFALFTAPLFSIVSFTAGGEFKQRAVNSDSYSLLRQTSAQEQSTPSPPSTLPFTPFSLQQEQETVPEEEQEQLPTDEGDQSLIQEPQLPTVTEGTAPPPSTTDDGQTTFQARPGQNVPLTPQPNEPTTRQGGDQSEGGGSNATVPSGDRQIESIAREGSFDVSSLPRAGEVYCGDTERRTGGGFNLPTPNIQITWSNSPASWAYLNGWLVSAKNTVSGSDSAIVYTVCAKITPEDRVVDTTIPNCPQCVSGTGFIQTYVREGETNIEPNRSGAIVASCNVGQEIIGGGFGALAYTEDRSESRPIRHYSEPDILIYKSYPSGNGWAVEAKNNHQTLPTELWAFAVCAKVITSVSSNFAETVSQTEQVESNPRYVPLTVSPNSQNSVVSSCREGETITAGGFYSQSSDISVYKSYPSGNGWAVEANNWNPTEGRSLSVYAMCTRVVPMAQQITPATVPPTGNATGTTTPTTNDTGGVGGVTEVPSSATEPPLRVEAIANATQAIAPATIRLDANITGGAPPYSYSWSDPNLGLIDQDRSITLNFFEPGTFTYTLTVTDSRGKTVTDNVQIVISERVPTEGIVAPEPGGIAPPPTQEEGGAILEPAIPPPPPPTVPEGEGEG